MEAKARKKIKAVRANQKLSAKMDGVVGDSDTSDKVPATPETPNPKPQTPNPQPSTLNPEP